MGTLDTLRESNDKELHAAIDELHEVYHDRFATVPAETRKAMVELASTIIRCCSRDEGFDAVESAPVKHHDCFDCMHKGVNPFQIPCSRCAGWDLWEAVS